MKSIAFWLAWLKGEYDIELSFSTTLSFCEEGLSVSALCRQPFTQTLAESCPPNFRGSASARNFTGFPTGTDDRLSGRRFVAPLIPETRGRIAGDRLAMAEPGSVE